MSHTPGPWEWDGPVWDYDVDQEAPWLVTALGEKVIHGEVHVTSEANARLISTAPDGLELARSVVACGNGTCGHGEDLYRCWVAMKKQARSIIARAEGK